MALDRIPTAADFEAYRVTNSGQSEITRQRLYDWLLYPTAGQAQFSFFAQPVGQGITTAPGGTVGSGKTQQDTNMEMANTLPSGKQYLVQSIEVLFLPGSVNTANTYTAANIATAVAAAAVAVLLGANNDVQSFYQSGMLEFNILSKNYLREAPLLCFPPKAHYDIVGSIGNADTTTHNAVAATLTKATGRPYYIDPEVTLQPAVNFEVLIKYPAPVATPSGFNGRVGVFLDGFMMRASQ
jgi:hypothetical protein